MTSYGNYSKPAYGGGGEDGGGFLGASQQGSQRAEAGGKTHDDSLRPVTIKQLLDLDEAYPDAEFAIDGAPIAQVTLVGQVREIKPLETNVTYRLDDGTGIIEVKKWVDITKQNEEDEGPGLALGQYVRVWGRLKSFNQKKHVGAHFIRPIEDPNEIAFHMLECTYVHLYFTKGPLGGGGGAAGGNQGGGGGEDSMFVDSYAGGSAGGGGVGSHPKVASCTQTAQRMFNFLYNSPGGNEGMHMNMVTQGTGMGVREVLNAADELLGQGLIYTTIDDETWAILDY